VVVFGLLIFAYTTLLGWSYYGERCAEYIFGVGIITPYRYAWIVMIFIGALAKDQLALLWDISDALNGLMALPNIVALLLLSPVIFRITQEYFENEKKK
jgi:AGCS family alanine or glycine:cation symporter